MTRKALIVVDVQNDFCEGGSLAVVGGEATAQAVYDKLLRGDNGYATVVATLDYHSRNGDNGGHFHGPDEDPDYNETWPAHCVQGTPGAGFKAPLDAAHFEEIFTKGNGEPAFSGFQGTGEVSGKSLEEYLREKNVEQVDVVGIAFDYCVKATALDGAKAGFTTTVLKEFTASVSTDNDSVVIEELELAGVVIA